MAHNRVTNFEPGKFSEKITDTAEHTGNFRFVEAFGGDAVISAMDNQSFTPSNAFDGFTLADGRIIQGDIRSITLTSGMVVAYT